jgi:hypothetical protein
MDANRFDALTRALTGAASSRRRLLIGVGGGGLGALATMFGLGETGASHSGCRHVGVHCNRNGQCCSSRCRNNRCRAHSVGGCTAEKDICISNDTLCGDNVHCACNRTTGGAFFCSNASGGPAWSAQQMPSVPVRSASVAPRASKSITASAPSAPARDSPPPASSPARSRCGCVSKTGSRTSISTRRCFAACCTASSTQPPAKMRKPLSENAGDDGEACGAIRQETARCPIHVPSQDPSGARSQVPSHLGSPSLSTRPDTRPGLPPASCRRSLARPAMQRHHPARMVDGPGARAAAGGNGMAKGILQGASVQRGINPGPGDGASEIWCQVQTITRAHQRCSSSQRATHPSQTSAMMASAVMTVSTTTRDSGTGRRTQDTRGTRAVRPGSAAGSGIAMTSAPGTRVTRSGLRAS